MHGQNRNITGSAGFPDVIVKHAGGCSFAIIQAYKSFFFVFGLNDKQAQEQLDEIKRIVENNWRILAKKYNLGRAEIENMAPAF